MLSVSASIFRCKVQMESSSCKFQPAIMRFNHSSAISKYKVKHQILWNHSLLPLSTGLRLQNTYRDKYKNNMVLCSSVGPGPSLPSPDPGSWKLWVVGILMSIILPFWRNKWGPLSKLKEEVESVIEKVETVADVVEKVAEQVEEVADDIGNHLPEGRLKDVLEFVEDIAQDTADGARFAGDIIDKVEEVEETIESWMEQNTANDGEAMKTKKEEEEEEEEKEAAKG